jgi:hypothetical protein
MSEICGPNPVLVQCELAVNDVDVTDPEQAAELIVLLFGEPRQIEPSPVGGWLIELNADELDRLQREGWFELEQPETGAVVSAEYPGV